MPKFLAALLLALAIAQPAAAEIKTEAVEYKAGDTVLKGYIAYDDRIKGKRPGVLVVHEWWGHNDYVERRARMLAEMGYTALALDMYGDGKQAAHPGDAGKFSGEIRKNLPLMTARFNAAYELLAAQPTVDKTRIAAIGYCFGGAVVLEMARAGADLRGVASFHGSLDTEHPAERGKVKARVLVMNGADDPFTKPEQIEAFKQEMKAAKVRYQFINYPGAKHAFTNPDADRYGQEFKLPLAYNAEADRKSWIELKAFLKKVFAKN